MASHKENLEFLLEEYGGEIGATIEEAIRAFEAQQAAIELSAAVRGYLESGSAHAEREMKAALRKWEQVGR